MFYLKDHLIGKEHVLPGVVYLEMARAAGNLAKRRFGQGSGERLWGDQGKSQVRKIQNTIWAKPIILTRASQAGLH